jgi:plasmid stabilization system protein ParE
MSAFRLIVTPRAASDLEHIYDWIARDSTDRARSMVQRIMDALEPLKEFPHRTVVGHQNPRLRYPARSLVVRPYVIYFRVLEDKKVVRVLHVRHGARRAPKRLE